MTNYDAVVYIDTDINIVGDVVPLLECAATGEFMMTQGLHAPLNAGVMALKPNEELLKLSMWFAERASFSQHPEDITNNKGRVRVRLGFGFGLGFRRYQRRAYLFIFYFFHIFFFSFS